MINIVVACSSSKNEEVRYIDIDLLQDKVIIEGTEFDRNNQKVAYESFFKELMLKRKQAGFQPEDLRFRLRIENKLSNKEISDFHAFLKENQVLYLSRNVIR